MVVTEVTDGVTKAVGVRLADNRVFRAKTVISNATRWDTFSHMIREEELPQSEKLFRERYKKSPSFLSIHMGVKAECIPEGMDCHHVLLDDWEKMEDARGTVFGLHPDEYERKKEEMADMICERLEAIIPGIKDNIVYREVGTPKTHRRFLSREDGTYGPIPTRPPLGMLSMPFNMTDINGLYCVGDSTFPGQGVNAVVFSGFGCAHRVLCDIGKEPTWPAIDAGFVGLLGFVRDRT
eukprot:gene9668-8492_t